MSNFIEESDEYITQFTREEIDKILHIVNNLILTEKSDKIFTFDDIDYIVHANKYTNLFFSYALLISQHIESDSEKSAYEILGGGNINTTILLLLFLVIFNTVFVDAGLFKGRHSVLRFTPFKTIPYGTSHQKISRTTIELVKTVVELSTTLHKYTPPLLTDITNLSMMTTHTATIAEMTFQRRIHHIYNYIIQNILLRKIKSTVKKQITIFIHSCFIKEIAPIFFPQLHAEAIKFADIILWCVQNKIPETLKWGKKQIKEVMDFYETQFKYLEYTAGKKTQKKRLSIRSKKNIKHRKKNTKITIKKTMMNRMMFPK